METKRTSALLDDAVLCIDQGTTNSKAVLLNRRGHIIARSSSALTISHPQPGWVEQSADDIWSSVVEAIKLCIEQVPSTNITAIGLSNQRESVVRWDAKSGKPIGPTITWQCRRTANETEKLKADGCADEVLTKTGLPLDPLFPATKIRWLLDLEGGNNNCIGTVDSWLIWKLTAGKCFATDRSNASRTQLMNLKTGEWDTELCSLFGVNPDVLATVTDSQHQFGHTKSVPNLPDGVPVASAIGDSHAALFGHAAFLPGEAKATFGTGSSVMMISPELVVPSGGMTTTIAWSIDGRITYALEGNILVSASLFPWVANLLGLDGDVDKLMELAATVETANGVSLVPALVGLGAPHWNPQARGILTGISFASTPAHVAHAAALSMSLQVVDVFHAMHKQAPANGGRIFVDGGPTKNKFLMQQLANLLSQPVTVSVESELSALGAGMLAGLSTGFWTSLDEIESLDRDRVTIVPTMAEQDRSTIISIWNNAILKCTHANG